MVWEGVRTESRPTDSVSAGVRDLVMVSGDADTVSAGVRDVVTLSTDTRGSRQHWGGVVAATP